MSDGTESCRPRNGRPARSVASGFVVAYQASDRRRKPRRGELRRGRSIPRGREQRRHRQVCALSRIVTPPIRRRDAFCVPSTSAACVGRCRRPGLVLVPQEVGRPSYQTARLDGWGRFCGGRRCGAVQELQRGCEVDLHAEIEICLAPALTTAAVPSLGLRPPSRRSARSYVTLHGIDPPSRRAGISRQPGRVLRAVRADGRLRRPRPKGALSRARARANRPRRLSAPSCCWARGHLSPPVAECGQ